MAEQKPLRIGTTVPIQQFEATDTIPPGNVINGVPAGGTTGQVLEKVDGTDYNTHWATPSGGGGGASYLVYTALLTQSGTDAPVATVLENTTGATITYSYDFDGAYTATADSGVFTENKTTVSYGGTFNDDGFQNPIFSTPYSAMTTSSIPIRSATALDGYFNGLLLNTMIEIRIYP